jgi:hypothetical protein
MCGVFFTLKAAYRVCKSWLIGDSCMVNAWLRRHISFVTLGVEAHERSAF